MSHEKPDWLTPETLAYLRDVEYRFHVRAFGEEMARVNFMPLEQRKQYLCDMLDHAHRKGVKFDEPTGTNFEAPGCGDDRPTDYDRKK
jgi:hypothetical protein